MRVLVLGGYGLIGLEVSRELLRQRFAVAGLARSARRGYSLLPQAEWIGADISTLTAPKDWTPYLSGIDVVVNASGALQSGARDNLAAVQRDAICALIKACEQERVSSFIQISAPGAELDADTEFLRTKAEADQALRGSSLKWVILKPGLVISPSSYGGTSLLRMLTAFPYVQPLVLPEARIQTVGVYDVARAVVRCLTDPELAGRDYDLVEPAGHTLQQIVLAFRSWLGFSEPARVINLPVPFGFAIARLADFAGTLGWRSPLRTTALKVLEGHVTGDPEPWRRDTGFALKSLAETLADLPSTLQERLFARIKLVFPLLLLMLSLFWIVSGVIGFWQYDAAVSVADEALGQSLASISVLAGSAIDILIGAGLLVNRTFRQACFASIAVSLLYLAAGSIVTPDLWLDPLGPFVKVIPAIGLALVLAAAGEER